jgi:hypothetical protein
MHHGVTTFRHPQTHASNQITIRGALKSPITFIEGEDYPDSDVDSQFCIFYTSASNFIGWTQIRLRASNKMRCATACLQAVQ